MNREQKTQAIAQYNTVFNDYGAEGTIIVTEYAGINVTDFKRLRKQLRDNGAKMAVVKNRLAKIALRDTECDESLQSHFNGPVSIAYSKDPVSLTKTLVDFAKDNEALKIKAGVMDGESLDSAKIKALSNLPSLDQLRAQLLSLIMTPARDIASIIHQLPSSLARVIKAKSEK